MMETIHVPVLKDEVLQWLNPANGKIFVDGTLGGGGHAKALAAMLGDSGQLLALDRDPDAVKRMQQDKSGLPIKAFNANYCQLPALLDDLGFDFIDGMLIDLGLSSDQLDDPERGFSYLATGSLDMRFNPEEEVPAQEWLEHISEKELADTIYQYGEERFSRRIARTIVEQRRKEKIETAQQLADIVKRCVPRSKGHSIHPATRTFQAIRIAINDELGSLKKGLEGIPNRLKPGARLAIISFHSLEDRIVKNAFRDDPRLKVLTRKVVRPSEQELRENRRSRSSKLRVAERVEQID